MAQWNIECPRDPNRSLSPPLFSVKMEEASQAWGESTEYTPAVLLLLLTRRSGGGWYGFEDIRTLACQTMLCPPTVRFDCIECSSMRTHVFPVRSVWAANAHYSLCVCIKAFWRGHFCRMAKPIEVLFSFTKRYSRLEYFGPYFVVQSIIIMMRFLKKVPTIGWLGSLIDLLIFIWKQPHRVLWP